MSTNNFKFKNILITLPSFNYDYKKPCNCCNDEDCEFAELDSEFDEDAYNEYVKDLQTQLAKIGFDSCYQLDNDRNYNGTKIARYGLEDNDGMIVWLEVVIRAGYYDGANVDYTIDGDWGGLDEGDYTKARAKKYASLHNKLDKQVARLEKILRKNGTEMLKVGQFSNGEAVYKLAK